MFDVITYILSRRGIGSYTPSGGSGGNVMDVKVNGTSVVNAGGVARITVPTTAEDIGAIEAPSAATPSDVGKTLKVKTVSGGKVTEYEFGDAVMIDATLSNSGEAADAKAAGDRISKMNNVLNYANLVNAFDGTLFQGYWTSAGVRTSYNSDVCNANKIPCPAGATVTLTAQTNVSGLNYFMSYLDDTGRLLRDTGTGTTYSGQAPTGTKWFCFCFEKSGLQPSDFTGVSIYINSLVDKVDGLTSEIDKLNDEIGQIGISSRVKDALLNCFKYVAWINGNGQNYYDALESALNNSIEGWETVRTFASSDLSYKKQMSGIPPTYYNAKDSRASYLAFDIPVEYGYTYKFEYTTTLATSNIAFAFYNQNAYNAVQNQQQFTNAELLDPGWQSSGYEITVPATINNSPIKGVRFTFRADNSTSSTPFQGGEITSVTIKRRRNS